MAHHADYLGINLLHIVAHPMVVLKEVAFFGFVMDDVDARNVGNLVHI